ncbi:10857_t:CDS:2 [Funneliformis mosseae]|uniref:10857_t:CDS:1 n=1 Tax=Funneliformis mosseae TaxID=27381 RepID=A0A9N8WCX8_FUNMO|nr:10857_t:CDS:2 [Funneliformis mosseae]
MSESANVKPFVCKWDTHSEPQHFETQEKLRKHIAEHDINSCNKSCLRDPFYICPWEGCNKQQSDIIKLEEHLRRHTQQRPFNCPICNGSRFDSPDTLIRHLIIKHNDFVLDSDTDDYTLYDENEELNLGKVKDKNDVHVKKVVSKDEAAIFIKENNKDEIIPLSNTAKISYRDVRVNETKDTDDFMTKRYKHEMAFWDLFNKGIEAISLLPDSQIEYDSENENYDDLSDASQEVLSESEQDKLIFETFRKVYKDTKAGEYFEKAFEMLERGP